MKTELRLRPYPAMQPDAPLIVDVYHDGVFLASIYGLEERVIRIASKQWTSVTSEVIASMNTIDVSFGEGRKKKNVKDLTAG